MIPVAGLMLEALYHRGVQRPPALLVAPMPKPPAAGSPMDLPILAELAWALHRADHATLRFNPRGLGASQGRPGDHAAHVEDAEAALGQLLANERVDRAAVLAVGGAAHVGLELAGRSGCAGLLLVAPPEEAAVAVAAATAGIPLRVLLAEGVPWPQGGSVERVEGADATFLRGLPALGKAAAAFVAGLGR